MIDNPNKAYGERQLDLNIVLDLEEWCSEYVKKTEYTGIVRFCIATYQISQVPRNWGQLGHLLCEASGACIIHALCALRCVEGSVNGNLPKLLSDLEGYYSPKDTLRAVTTAMRHYFYFYHARNGSIRAHRFNLAELELLTAILINQMLAGIPRELRGRAIEQAGEVLLKNEHKR